MPPSITVEKYLLINIIYKFIVDFNCNDESLIVILVIIASLINKKLFNNENLLFLHTKHFIWSSLAMSVQDFVGYCHIQ